MLTDNNGRMAEILLVEDNPGDVRLTMEVLKRCKLRNRVTAVKNGVEAIAFLRRQGDYAAAPRPDLILLDLNMPRKDGRSVLEEIKADPELRLIPVVVLTSSRAEEDIARSYELHANCYVTKPINLEQFVQVIQAVDNFWLEVVTLPPKDKV